MPPPEHVHWLFATGFLALGLFLVAEAVVGREVWRKRRWRAYLWPSTMFGMGLAMWPVMVFFTSSTLAHARPRRLGRGDDDRGGRRARARQREAAQPAVAAGDRRTHSS